MISEKDFNQVKEERLNESNHKKIQAKQTANSKTNKYTGNDLITFITFTSIVFYASTFIFKNNINQNPVLYSHIIEANNIDFESIKLSFIACLISLCVTVMAIPSIDAISSILKKTKDKILKREFNKKSYEKGSLIVFVIIILSISFNNYEAIIKIMNIYSDIFGYNILVSYIFCTWIPFVYLIRHAKNTVIKFTVINAFFQIASTFVIIEYIKNNLG